MSDKHSPLPFARGAQSFNDSVITDASGVIVAVCTGSDHETETANAEFITRACNAHYELRAACEFLMESASNEGWLTYKGTDDERTGFPDIRAAIAKARGEAAASTSDGLSILDDALNGRR